MFLYDPNSMLSPHYSLGDLTKTNQSLQYPNLPDTTNQYDNLVDLANVLEVLLNDVGPFQILSGFRTKELQNALSAQGDPTSAGTSFHELGRAVDIYPTTMTIDEYFGRILANENLKNMFAEISIKPKQNALHLSINVPGDVRTPKILGLNESGSYIRLTLDEIASYIAPFSESLDAAYDYAAAKLVTFNKTPLILGMVAAMGGVIYLALAGSKRESRSNPRPKKFPSQVPPRPLSHLSAAALKKYGNKLERQLGFLEEAQDIDYIETEKTHKLLKMYEAVVREEARRRTNPRLLRKSKTAKHLTTEQLHTLASRLRRKYGHLFNVPTSSLKGDLKRIASKKFAEYQTVVMELARRSEK